MDQVDQSLTADRVFRALADPTRRTLMSLLCERARSVRELTSEFEITQSAVSQHLKILRDAEIVSERKVGRLRVYAFNPEPLLIARAWLTDHTEFWQSRLENLGAHLRSKHDAKP
jgi:DNA-binding transcriptional ArsR family regulator